MSDESGDRAALPDTGERESFGEGLAYRESDPDKPAVEGISPFFIERLGTHLTNGGKKYGNFRNWEAGMPFTRCVGAIIRHVFQYLRRDDSEDHLAAIAWNAMALIHYEETKPELDDRPAWRRPPRITAQEMREVTHHDERRPPGPPSPPDNPRHRPVA